MEKRGSGAGTKVRRGAWEGCKPYCLTYSAGNHQRRWTTSREYRGNLRWDAASNVWENSSGTSGFPWNFKVNLTDWSQNVQLLGYSAAYQSATGMGAFLISKSNEIFYFNFRIHDAWSPCLGGKEPLKSVNSWCSFWEHEALKRNQNTLW